MNKAISINLVGSFFHIEEDAYNYLEEYLRAIQSYFAREEGQAEIVEDIEARIAEMFQEGLQKHRREVVLFSDVELMIRTMGLPEEFDETAQTAIHQSLAEHEVDKFKRQTVEKFTDFNKKRLYRNPEEKVLSGLAAGLAAYFNINEPIWIRLGFVLSMFALGPIPLFIYIVFWFITPPARTKAQQLAMRGEQVNISSIERMFREDVNPNRADDIQVKGIRNRESNYLL